MPATRSDVPLLDESGPYEPSWKRWNVTASGSSPRAHALTNTPSLSPTAAQSVRRRQKREPDAAAVDCERARVRFSGTRDDAESGALLVVLVNAAGPRPTGSAQA